MASAADVAALRLLIADTDPNNQRFTDQELSDILDAAGSQNKAALIVWENKAASASEIVNVSESGSTRSMGDIFKNAQAMIAYFKGRVKDDDPTEPIRRGSTTRRIERL